MMNENPAPQSVNPDLIRTHVSIPWLYQQLNSSTEPPIVIDCRFSLADPQLGRRQYETSHLPGAHYFDLNQDLSSPVKLQGGRHPLPDIVQLSEKLAAVGVRSGDRPTPVIIYDDSRFAFAARLWWLLRYMGHDRAAVLDGGWSRWLAAGYPVTAEIPRPQPGNFRPQVQTDWAVDIETVKARKAIAGVVLVDSREGERYRGEQEPIDPIAGHIPGAVNYPWQEASDSKGYLRSVAEQQQRWANIPAEEILVYCGSGVTACVNLLSLAIAGISTGKLYAGSWSDWCSYLPKQKE